MKQRLGVAAALLGDPELLVLDEPTNGLDPAGMADMRRCIVDLAATGRTVLLSSHLLSEVQEVCDRVGVISHGRLLTESTVADIRGTSWLYVRAEPTDVAVAVATRFVGDDARTTDRVGHPAGHGRRCRTGADPGAGRRRSRRARDPDPGTLPRRGLLRDHHGGPPARSVRHPAPTDIVTREYSAMNAVRTVRSTGPSALLASTRAELLRLRKWPVLWVMVGVGIVLDILFGYVFDYLSYRTGDSSEISEGVPPAALLDDLLPTGVPETTVQGMPMFGGAMLLILGALAVGGGYGWGTWKTVFTQGLSRASAFGGTLDRARLGSGGDGHGDVPGQLRDLGAHLGRGVRAAGVAAVVRDRPGVSAPDC